MRSSRSISQRLLRWSSVVVFFVGLAFFLATRARSLAPALSAPYVARALGLDPFPLLLHPAWSAMMRTLRGLVAPQHAVAAANVVNAVLGAWSLALLYALVRRWPFLSLPDRYRSPRVRQQAGTVSGIIAAAVLAGAIPFWLTATRAHPAALDTAWLLWCAWLAQRAVQRPRRGLLLGLALLWGAGCVQSATFIALTPVAVLLGLWIMLRGNFLSWHNLLAVALAGAAGLGGYLLQAAWYMRQPAFEWREFSGFFHVLLEQWRLQYGLLRASLVPTGWIVLAAGTLLPWIFLFVMPLGSSRQRRFGAGSIVLFSVLVPIAGALLFNAPIAPWRMTGVNPLLVLPYVLLAAWAGRLAGLWFLLATHTSRQATPRGLPAVVRLARPAMVLLALAAAAAAARNNFPVVDTRPGSAVHHFAHESIRSMQGRTWLISDGILDDALRVAAFEQEHPLEVLNLRLTQHRPYLRYLASRFDDVRLKGLARLGLAALIGEWYQQDPDIAQNVAVLSSPDDIIAGGLIPVPRHTLFLAARERDALDIEALFVSHQEFWDALSAAPKPAENNPASPWVGWVRLRASRVANNLGVLLEDLERGADAFRSYAAARALDPDNVSALLNQLDLAARTRDEAEEALRAEVEQTLARRGRRLPLWSLAAHYGYIRRPEAYASIGWVWALSGKPNVAIHEIRRALELAGPQASWQSALGALYFQEGEDEKSAEAYLEALQQDPDHRAALLGLARVDMRRGSFESARGYLDRLAELGYNPLDLAMEEAALESLAGRPERVREILLRVVEQDPARLRAWVALAVLAVEEGDAALAERALQRFEPARRVYPGLGVTLAGLEIQRGELERARIFLEQALRVAQDRPAALEQMLRLNVFERRRDLAERHARMLLSLDPGHAYANHIMGTIVYSQGQLVLAENYFQAALRRQRFPDAINDLAWLLYRRGEYDRALPLAREAAALRPDSAVYQDTLGMILLALDRVDEAEQALRAGLLAMPEHPTLIYHMALLLERKDLGPEAERLVRPLLDRVAEMDEATYEGVRELLARQRAED